MGNIVKAMYFPAMQHGRPVAMQHNLFGLVRDYDHSPVFALFKKFDLAFLMKPVIAYGDDFVDQKTVKLNHHGEGERRDEHASHLDIACVTAGAKNERHAVCRYVRHF
jgi:hypothetical protein